MPLNRRKSRRHTATERGTEDSLQTESAAEIDNDPELALHPEDLPQDPSDEDYSGSDAERTANPPITDDLSINMGPQSEGDAELYEGEAPPPRRKGRGRPPGAKNRATLEREKRGIFKPFKKRLDSQDGRRKRRGITKKLDVPPTDEDGSLLEVVDGEIVVEPDVQGETKITPDGELLGGREFRVRTFPILGKGNRRFMLSTEPARCVGFRDSYLLFHKHKHLYKYVCSPEEKADLIERNLLPHAYKGRSISLVSARLIYREFGARVVVNGRRVTDDYYEQRARDSGAREGEIVDPLGALSLQYSPWNPLSGQGGPAKDDPQLVVLTDENWRYQHAISAVSFGEEMSHSRAQLLNHGILDPYSGLTYFPAHTQSLRAVWSHGDEPVAGKLVFTTVMKPAPRRSTALGSVPLEIFEGVVSDEVRAAIMAHRVVE